jgi:LmbE family N-acetylglucosaminyl deacetylase
MPSTSSLAQECLLDQDSAGESLTAEGACATLRASRRKGAVVAEIPCIVAVAAHAADMEFSAGGALLKHACDAWDAHIVHLTLGEKGNPSLSPDEYGAQKRHEAEEAAQHLRATPHFLPYADGELTASDGVARELAALLRRLQPQVIVSHWRDSIHADHTAAYHLTRRALFMAANAHFDLGELPRLRGARLYYADNWEDAESFQPFVYVDIGDVFDDWERAFKCYAIGRGEGGFPYWGWYEARTRLHGIAIGVAHAEAFAVDPGQMRQVQEML